MGKSRGGYIFGGFLMFLGCAAICTSVGLPKFLDISWGPAELEFGAFKICVQNNMKGQEGSSCANIDRYCGFDDSGLSFIGNCDKFNAFRGFLVISAFFAILATVVCMLHICKCKKTRPGGAFILGFIAALCGLISMALFVDLFRVCDVDDQDCNNQWGASFALLTAGWVVMLIGSFLYAHYRGGMRSSSDYFAF